MASRIPISSTFSAWWQPAVAVTVGLFALARIVASHTQDRQFLTEADYTERRCAHHPPAQVAIAGRDNSALAINAEERRGQRVVAPCENGTELFGSTCSACHGQVNRRRTRPATSSPGRASRE